MQEKSLPTEKPQNPLKLRLQSLLKRKPKKQLSEEASDLGNKSPNLLQNVLELQTLQSKEKQQFQISRVAIWLIVLIQILFVFLSLYNARMVVLTKNIQVEIKALEVNVLSKNLAEAKIKDVIKRTEFVKELEGNRVAYAGRVETFVEGIPANVFLNRSLMDDTIMSLTVETQSPLEVSLLISNYFDANFAKEVVIQSANLNKTENTFTTTLEVIF